MNYRKLPHSRLHHVETHRTEDGSYRVEAHVIHRPPSSAEKYPQSAYAVPGQSEIPNRVVTMLADTHEEATALHGAIAAAHRHEKSGAAGRDHSPADSADAQARATAGGRPTDS
jgi:hypothetical protein